jgi:magnesium chelatase subunit ChlD-like protein
MAMRAAPRTAPRGALARGIRRTVARGEPSRQLHWPRTLLAKKQAVLTREHLRFKNKIARSGVLHCFVLDCSGSMRTGKQLALAQGALQQLHQRAYQQRAKIALITYAGDAAVVRVHPTAARPFNTLQMHNWLPALQAGGATPLTIGITTADVLLAKQRRREPNQQCWLWLLSDGRSNELPERPLHADIVQIIDCEQQRIALNRCHALAERWQADYLTLNDLLANPQ